MNPLRTFCFFALLAIASVVVRGQTADVYPEYKPRGDLDSGELRSMGSPTMDEIALGWMTIFRQAYPEIEEATIEARDNSTAAAGLVSGQCQLGPMSREMSVAEIATFVKKFGYPPTAIRVCGGAQAKVGYSPALAIFVHQDNPLTQLTIAQLEEIFSKGGAITTWGQLGLTGEWADKKINLFGLPQPNGISRFLQLTAMHSRDLRPDITPVGRVGKIHALHGMVLHVAADRYALTYAAGESLQPGTKILAIASDAASPAALPTRENVASRAYPLSRYLYIYINRAPGKPIDFNVKEFLHIVLSRQGQEVVAQRSPFLPLSPAVVREELAKLDGDGALALSTDPNVTVQGGTPEEFHETFVAKADPALPAYKPTGDLSGKIVSIGTDSFEDLMKNWTEGFRLVQPKVAIQSETKGSMTGAPALTEGRAQLAPESREMSPEEIAGFKQRHGYEPLAIKVALGSYRTPERSGVLAVYVNHKNPIARATLAQLGAIFSDTYDPAHPGGYTKWGQLGLTGEWADRAIHVVGVKLPDGNATFMRHVVCADHDLRSEQKFEGIGPATKVWVRILADVAADPGAIGYASFLYPNTGVKRLAVAETAAGPYYDGQFEDVISARYPLTRFVYIYLDRRPGQPLQPEVREFMRYVLSREGQTSVEKDVGFMPIPANVALQELAKLD